MHARHSGRLRLAGRYAAALAAAFCFAAPPRALGAGAHAEPGSVVVEVEVNGAHKGELFLTRRDGGFWFDSEDLSRLGLRLPATSGEVRIDTIEGLEVHFDEGALRLSITADPRLFPSQEIKVSGPKVLDLTPAPGVSGYLNYDWNGERTSGNRSSNELRLQGNLAARDWLLRSEEVETWIGSQASRYRVATTLERDWPSRMLRLVMGDITAGAGQLSRTFDLGGISFGRGFDLRPGFISNPTAELTGISTSPGVAEIYIDGVRVATHPIGTGPFDLRNLSDFTGLRNIEIVIRDASGVRDRIAVPYYFTTTLLAAGLTDFNISAGAQRVGTFSDTYAQGAFSAFVAHGITDDFTAGIAAQATSGYRFAGARLAARSTLLGVASLDVGSQRTEPGGTKGAAVLSWSYTHRSTTLRALLRDFERGYSTSVSTPTIALPQVSREASLGWDQALAPRVFGSITATERRFRDDAIPTHEYRASMSIGLFGNGSLLLSAVQTQRGELRTTSGSIIFSYNLDSRRYVQATGQRDISGAWDYTAQAVQTLPEGEGVGWRVAAETNPTTHAAETAGYWRMPRGLFTAEARQVDIRNAGPSTTDLRASVEGALACVGSHCEITQPVTDAFALVDLSGVPDVRVYRNNQEIGHTNAEGKLFIARVPSLTENAIRIADEDVPISVSVPVNTTTLVPGSGTGHLVSFDLRKISAARGRFFWDSSDGPRALENAEITLHGERIGEVRTRTGKGGLFEFDQLETGTYSAVVQLREGPCKLLIEIPAERPSVIELGDVTCEIAGI